MADRACAQSRARPPFDRTRSAYRFLARQPILDAGGGVRGYELLFRNGADPSMAGDGELATRTMIDNAVLYGLPGLAGGRLAFVNCTAHALLQDDLLLLPPEFTVLEVLESVSPTPEIVAACHKLRAAGFRFALDDFVYHPAWDPLIEIADYVKIDYLNASRAERQRTLAALHRFKGARIAEKVETPEEFKNAASEGFTLFQGYYFCHPVLVRRRKLPSNAVARLRLLQLLDQHPLDLKAISAAVKGEPSIAYRVLRLANSPALAIRNRVCSIESALLALGHEAFRRIALLAVTTELNSSAPAEAVRVALVRARFCETTASCCGFDPTQQYLLGLFSLLPAMLQVPMRQAIGDLAVPETIQAALLGRPGGVRVPLQWLECREHGDWETCDAFFSDRGVAPAFLNDSYAEAVVWSDQLLSGHLAEDR